MGDLAAHTVSFTVPGEPKSKERPRLGNGRNVYTPKATRDAEEVVAMYFRSKVGSWQPRRDMVRMRILFVVGTRRHRDIDNLEKLIADALNSVAYADDHQIINKTTDIEYQKGNPHTVVLLSFTGRTQWP